MKWLKLVITRAGAVLWQKARCNMKSIIWHYSLTSIYTECPYCHSQNSENERTGECKNCHNIMDFGNEVVKKSKDVLECEKLGLQGAVHKNDKGQWEQWAKQ